MLIKDHASFMSMVSNGDKIGHNHKQLKTTLMKWSYRQRNLKKLLKCKPYDRELEK